MDPPCSPSGTDTGEVVALEAGSSEHRRYSRRGGQTHFHLLRPAVLAAMAVRSDAAFAADPLEVLLAPGGPSVAPLLTEAAESPLVPSLHPKRSRRVSFPGAPDGPSLDEERPAVAAPSDDDICSTGSVEVLSSHRWDHYMASTGCASGVRTVMRRVSLNHDDE